MVHLEDSHCVVNWRHLANIADRTKRRIRWVDTRERALAGGALAGHFAKGTDSWSPFRAAGRATRCGTE